MAGATSVITDSQGQWEDVTTLLRTECAALDVGQLCHVPEFNLYDSIAAMELMDPKMDSGMNAGASEDATVKSFEDAVAKGLKVDGLTPPELISVIDRLLCLLVAWLQGNSLVQTLFTCLYLHNVDAVPDPVLKPVCIAFLKSLHQVVEHVRELVMFSDVAEEEDFSATLYGFTTQDDVKLAQALKDIGAAAKVVAGGDGAGWAPDASPELRAAVGKRMEFLEGLMAVLQSSGKVENVKKTPGLCKRAQKAGQELLASASLATADGIVGALDPIHPFINSKLLAPTPPREIESFTFVESVAFLDAEFGSLEAAADVSRCDSLEELDDFYDQFDRRDPGLLCRATLHQLAIGGEHVAGKVPMAELVSRSVADFDAITPAEWDAATLMGDEKVYVQLLQDFYTKGGALLHERYKLWGYNRARRRRKMAKFLPQVHTFYIQAYDTNAALHAVWAKHNHPLPRGCSTVIPYATRVCASVAIRYVLSGFELELYGPHEHHTAWWYLDYLSNFFERVHSSACQRRAELVDARARAASAAGSGGGKSAKKGKRGKAKKAQGSSARPGPKSKAPMLEWEFAEVLQLMIRGVLRAIDGCVLVGKAPTLASEFTSIPVLYHHRYGVLGALEQPQYVGYQSFASSMQGIRTRVEAGEFKPEALFVMAYHHFENAVKHAEGLLQGKTVPPGMRAQLSQIVRVAKGNMVSLRICSLPGGHPTVKMDFAEHPCFPILKFR